MMMSQEKLNRLVILVRQYIGEIYYDGGDIWPKVFTQAGLGSDDEILSALFRLVELGELESWATVFCPEEEHPYWDGLWSKFRDQPNCFCRLCRVNYELDELLFKFRFRPTDAGLLHWKKKRFEGIA